MDDPYSENIKKRYYLHFKSNAIFFVEVFNFFYTIEKET
jgi:hypothetical protein